MQPRPLPRLLTRRRVGAPAVADGQTGSGPDAPADAQPAADPPSTGAGSGRVRAGLGGVAVDLLHPFRTLARGFARLAGGARRRWAAASRERRRTLALLAGGCAVLAYTVPYGPVAAVSVLLAAAAWAGRDRDAGRRAEPARAAESPESARLRTVYEALVPHFGNPEDEDALYTHGGDPQGAFAEHAFEPDGRLSRLRLHYPAYFTDTEPQSRERIERLLHTKTARGRECHFQWNEEENHLHFSVLAPLPGDIHAQRFLTAPGETLLGFTDPHSQPRTIPVETPAGVRDEPPVIWRTGARAAAPHLLALGSPGAGTTTLLRSLSLQALQFADVVVVDGGAGDEFAFLAGRRGVLALAQAVPDALAVLTWVARETHRRLEDRAGEQRPLWLVLDRPGLLSHLARIHGHPDPQGLLTAPLRHGAAANVTIAVGDHLGAVQELAPQLREHTHARVLLGAAGRAETQAALRGLPIGTAPADPPPGRGYVRLGTGPVHRLQTPDTPHPHRADMPDDRRAALHALLPPRVTGAGGGRESGRTAD